MEMKTTFTATAMLVTGFVFANIAQAQAQSQTCTKGGDVRMLDVIKPGAVGNACDLRYTYNNGQTVKTPFHANNSAGFCAEKAAGLVRDLESQGFACAASGDVVAAAPAPATVAEAPAAPEQSVAEQPAPLQPASGQPASGQSAEDVINEVAEVLAETRQSDPTTPPAEKVLSEISIAEAAPEPVSAPAEPAAASGAPVTLTSAAAIAEQAPAPRKSAVGRLVGATPEAQPDPVKIAQAPAAEERFTPATTVTTPAIEEPYAEEEKPKKKSQKLRPAPEIIRGVLSAQSAAWNEGDLEAFMAGYWKSPDLRFVSGTEVTGGWSQTLKRYKNRYGDSGDLGQLSFKKLDVEMITDDVAIIVGRFYLEKGEKTDTGVFSLVMKQFDGRWRIVHDHTVGEQTASAE